MQWVWNLARPHVVWFLLPRSCYYFSFIQCVSFLFSVSKRGLWLFLTHMCLVLSRVVCPLCLSSLLLAQLLDRKCEIYFIWPELHCSFLTTGVTSLQITWLCAYCLSKVKAWGDWAYLRERVREGYKAPGQEKRRKGREEREKWYEIKMWCKKLLFGGDPPFFPSASNKLDCCYGITLGYRFKPS